MYFLFLAIAAFFYAVHEKIQHHYSQSIFYGWKPNWFWDPTMWDKSWKIFKYTFDVRHIAASFMIISCSAGMISAVKSSNPFFRSLPSIVQLLLCGVIWIVVFNYFFNRCFKRRR